MRLIYDIVFINGGLHHEHAIISGLSYTQADHLLDDIRSGDSLFFHRQFKRCTGVYMRPRFCLFGGEEPLIAIEA